jgi:hypothetical protein
MVALCLFLAATYWHQLFESGGGLLHRAMGPLWLFQAAVWLYQAWRPNAPRERSLNRFHW